MTDSKGYLAIPKNNETEEFEMYYKQLIYLAIT